MSGPPATGLRIEQLRITNYRVLRDVTFTALTPLTVLCGPNGSGKSTVFDVFAFLHQAFTAGLRSAWTDRNGISGIRSRGADGPIGFEFSYRARGIGGESQRAVYTLRIAEERARPVVVQEVLVLHTEPGEPPKEILSFALGEGFSWDEETGDFFEEALATPDLLAVSAYGQFARHPHVRSLRAFITGWYLSYVTPEGTRTIPRSGPEPRLSQSGDNLPNVVQYLVENHPDRMRAIRHALARWVPQFESVILEPTMDGRLLLMLKDRAFDEPVLTRFVSDGTLKLLAFLTVIYDPDSPPVVGIEEPENQLHPKLLPALAEELRVAADRSQVLVTTHSPEFVDMIEPDELWMIRRGDDGFSVVSRATDEPRLMAMYEAGGKLGALWNEGYLVAADPEPVW